MKGRLFLTILIISFSGFSIWCSFQNKEIDPQENEGYAWEEYEPSYFYKFQSVQDIVDSADRHFSGDKKNTVQYYNFIANIIRKRFYHGYSHYSLADNYLASLSGKLIWEHLSRIVITDDILKYPMAACSQQSLVLAEIFKKQKIDYRKIGFPDHFAVEGFIEGEWRYFDTNKEPHFNTREPIDKIVAKNEFNIVYSRFVDEEAFKNGMSSYFKGEVNEVLAPNATIFHRATKFFSSPGFAIFLLGLLLIFYSKPFGRKWKPSGIRSKLEPARQASSYRQS